MLRFRAGMESKPSNTPSVAGTPARETGSTFSGHPDAFGWRKAATTTAGNDCRLTYNCSIRYIRATGCLMNWVGRAGADRVYTLAGLLLHLDCSAK